MTGGPTVGGQLPVGDSVFGVSDMAGNMADWTRDTFDAEFYATSSDTNPVNLDVSVSERVTRGSSWFTRTISPQLHAVWFRTVASEFSDAPGEGIRCVIEAP